MDDLEKTDTEDLKTGNMDNIKEFDLDESNIEDIFGPNGLLAVGLPGYEYREAQSLMAKDVSSCYKTNSVYAVEAGTGIGKSFAYLIPALMYAFRNPDDRTVIATSTINLQKQLVEKDLPTLFRVLGKSCNTALAVGRSNYLCLNRLQNEIASFPALFDDESLLKDEEKELKRIYDFSKYTSSGLRNDYNGSLLTGAWYSVSSDPDLCRNNKCPFFTRCFYFKAKRTLSAASIIVCNHHLLFTDSKYRYENSTPYSSDSVLPAFDRLVIDEAHNIDRNASSLYTEEYSSFILRRSIGKIYAHSGKSRAESGKDAEPLSASEWNSDGLSSALRRKNFGVMRGSLLESLVVSSGDTGLVSFSDNIIKQIDLVLHNADGLNAFLLMKLKGRFLNNILINKAEEKFLFSDTKSMFDSVLKSGGALLEMLNAFSRRIAVTEENENLVNEFKVYARRIEDVLLMLRGFVRVETWGDEIHSVELSRFRIGKDVFETAVLKTLPLSVAKSLRESLFSKVKSVFCTSATLDVNDEFSYWKRFAGLPVPDKKCVTRVYESPFDYKEHLMLLVPHDARDYVQSEKELYTQYVTQIVEEAVGSAGGGALVLFTGYEMMRATYSVLKTHFSLMGINSFIQGETDRYVLFEKFKKDKDSVLFATSSFWEGIDAPGDTLRLVIITKLPFPSPEEPVYKARKESMMKKGASSIDCFNALSLPYAVTHLKQGYGRLMRHTSDRGIVLILDSRIIKKYYGRYMIEALPKSYVPECTIESIGQKIESFLY